MFNPDLLLAQLNNDEEALVIISALGFSMAEWTFIKHVGGPLHVLASDLFINVLNKKLKTHPKLAHYWSNFRDRMDNFYDQQGFLLTPSKSLTLFKIPQAPLVFFGRFNAHILESTPQVAIVGARDACERGLQWSKSLAACLATHKINVISGGAQGIDYHAHKGALEQGGTTCMVSGVACDLYEQAKKINTLYDRERSVILYPFGPFFPQGKYMFVQRNKYVVAQADAVVVVQGKQGSGTLHTARFAEMLNVPLYAVPGSLDNPLSYVPNQLLQNNRARAVADFTQIAQALVTNQPHAPKKHKKEEESSLLHSPAAEEEEKPLAEMLMLIKKHGGSLSMSEILALSGKSFLPVQKELLEFELSGRIIKQGAQFVLTGR